MSKKVGPYGGRGGDEFDDGVYDHVCKVIVGEDSHGVVYIKNEYMKNERIVQREHGRNTKAHIEPHFLVDYPNEYITSIWGTYRDDRYNDLTISELQFKTSYGRTSQRFGKPGSGSKEFVLEGKNGTKLVGLHGRSGDFLDAIGAHFVFVSYAIKQLEPQGGSHWVSWDDGVYDSLSKVCIEEDGERLSYVEFEYVKGDQEIVELIPHSHGKKQQRELKTFVLDYENEYVKSVEGTYNGGFVSSLTFITNSRKSGVFGTPVGTKFVLEAKGFDKLVGFRGRSFADHVSALGAHFAVLVAPTVTKLRANGSDFGEEWDDGIHDNVRKITITDNGQSVKSIQFEYVNGAYPTIIGDVHGDINENHNKTEFVLEENEFITSVEGHYGQKLPIRGILRLMPGCCLVTMLRFNTNMDSYVVLGNEQGKYESIPFLLAREYHKIVGFYGKSTSSLLQLIGAYVKPIHDA